MNLKTLFLKMGSYIRSIFKLRPWVIMNLILIGIYSCLDKLTDVKFPETLSTLFLFKLFIFITALGLLVHLLKSIWIIIKGGNSQ